MILISFTAAIADPLVSYLIKSIIDDISGSVKIDFSNMNIIAILTVDLLCFVAYRLHGYFIHNKFKSKIRKNVSDEAIDKFLQKNNVFFQFHMSGALSNKINDIATNMPDMFEVIFDKFLCQLILIFSGIYFISQSGFIFAALMLGWILSFVILSTFVISRINNLSHQFADRISSSIGKVVDVFSNILTVRIFGSYRFEKRLLSDELEKVKKSQVKLANYYFWIFTYYGVSFVVFEVLCFYYLIQGYNQGIISGGDFVNVLYINAALVHRLWELAMDSADFSNYFGKISQALSVMIDRRVVHDPDQTVKFKVTKGKIEFNDVTFKYEDGLCVFEGESVVINPKEKIGLVGHSGAGKSTFVNLLLRLYKLSSGSIRVDGMDISKIDYDDFYNAFCVVPQDSAIFYRSVLDNIKYGDSNSTIEEAIEAAKKAHAHDFISKLPNGYDTMIGQGGVKLSGGQKQRILIARAIQKNSPIVILDESTSQLDSVTEKNIQKSLENLMKDKTAIVIAHRLSTVLNMDRIFVLEKGKIIASGKHDDLIKNCEIYKNLWQTQVDSV